MKDFDTQLAEATRECVQCSQEFTVQNPCCCDDGLFLTPEGDSHTDGVCVQCCRRYHTSRRFNAGTERSE